MHNTNFVEWLQEELISRNWNKAELARRSGISPAQITRIIKREQQPGIETCNSIARAFKLPPETVFREAGLLPPYLEDGEEPPTLKEWILYYLNATEEERDWMLEIAKTLSQRTNKGKQDDWPR